MLKSDGMRIANKLAVNRMVQDTAENIGRGFVIAELYREFRDSPVALTRENEAFLFGGWELRLCVKNVKVRTFF